MDGNSKRSLAISLIQQVGKHLWQGRVHGRAAVMVGAGFSKNARRTNSAVPEMPLWKDLARSLAHDLSTDVTDLSGLDPTTLASQYEARFGRVTLNKRLTELIPDLSYEPGALHVRLLNLPWADVFSTNFVTLLERTARGLKPNRRYLHITTQEGIVGSSQPRIVKVHGTMPNQTPFIVTTEDYNNYPSRFPIFVNTVLQSLVENTFLLIGFSADDPNFTNWISWVQQNLTDSKPKIYLCDKFGATDETIIKEYEKKNIAAIDLDSLFDDPAHLIAYEDAYDKLFELLEQQAPSELRDWPSGKSKSSTSDNGERSVIIQARIDRMRSQRLAYPGWIVCPHQIRKRLWESSVKIEIQDMRKEGFLSDLPTPVKLDYLFELNWQHDQCLYQLFECQARSYMEVISTFKNQQRADTDQEKLYLQSQETASKIAHLAISLLRDARDEMNVSAHAESIQFLESHDWKDLEICHAIYYERCLWEWHWLRFDAMETILQEWSKLPPSPKSTMRRATMLVVVGQYDAGWTLLEELLIDIRCQLQVQTENLHLLSIESWVMMTLNCRHVDNKPNTVAQRQERRGRWVQLEQYLCDPWGEIKESGHGVIKPPKPERTETAGFDPGVFFVTQSLFSGNSEQKLRDCHAHQRLHEKGAFPIRVGSYATDKAEVLQVVSAMLRRSTIVSISLALRHGDKELLAPFSRQVIGILPTSMLEHLCAWLTEIVIELTHRIPISSAISLDKPSPERRTAGNVIELLSRLAVRMDDSRLNELTNFACQLYCSPSVRANYDLHAPLTNLLGRSIRILSESGLIDMVLALVELPLANCEGSPVSLDEWPEPCDYVRIPSDGSSIPRDARSTRIQARTQTLMAFMENEHILLESRSRALRRLVFLFRLGYLDNESSLRLADQVWKCWDPSKLIQARHCVRPWRILPLLELMQESTVKQLKGWLLEHDLSQTCEVHADGHGYAFPPTIVSHSEDLIEAWNHLTAPMWRPCVPGDGTVRWTDDQAEAAIRSIIAFWQAHRDEVAYRQSSSNNAFLGGFSLLNFFNDLVDLLTKSLMPYLKKGHSVVDEIERTLGDMESLGISTNRHIHMLLWHDQGRLSSITRRVHAGILSTNKRIASDSMFGVLDWKVMARTLESQGDADIPQVIRSCIVALIQTRNTPAYGTLCEVCARLLIEFPDWFSHDDLESICLGLNGLLAFEQQRVKSYSADYDAIVFGNLLSAEVIRRFNQLSVPVPVELDEWRNFATTTIPLRELRDSWPSPIKDDLD